ncbi:hypothetical protein [Mammaliicoccus sciuri]|uniref:hypothetical protein n=1 Tax=Mammaliicoccus sciuri TaxID=1296 RepID=UPI003F57DECE
MKVGVVLIEEFENEDLKDPKNLRIIINDLSKKVRNLKHDLETVDSSLNNPDDGIKVSIKDIKDDLEELDGKLKKILDSQGETRKTIKTVSLTTVFGGIISAIVGFVMKQLGFF